MQTSLIINTTDTNDKALQKTLTFVNASCPASVLKTAAQKLNALTTNTYVKAARIDKTDLATATDKQQLVLTGTKYKVGDGAQVDFTIGDTITINIPDTDFATKKKITLYWSSGTTSMSRPIITRATTEGSVSSNSGMQYWQGSSNWVDTATFSSSDPQTFTYRIQYAADDTHLAYDTTITFNLVSGGE